MLYIILSILFVIFATVSLKKQSNFNWGIFYIAPAILIIIILIVLFII